MPKIALPTPLRPYTEGAAAVEAAGATVGEALAELTARYPPLRRHLFDDAGRLRSFVNVYRNDEDVRYPAARRRRRRLRPRHPAQRPSQCSAREMRTEH
jgi:sulfur-carrier protein